MSRQQSATSIELSDALLSRIEDRVELTEFESASEYVEYVLEDVLHHVEQSNDVSLGESVEEDTVQDRLKSLGYLNE